MFKWQKIPAEEKKKILRGVNLTEAQIQHDLNVIPLMSLKSFRKKKNSKRVDHSQKLTLTTFWSYQMEAQWLMMSEVSILPKI